MRVRKENVTFDLKDTNQIDAFRNSTGWIFEDEGIATDTPSNINTTSEPETEKDTPSYSRSDITRMSTADLKTLAASIGIEVTDESTGKALKEAILSKLGL